MELAAIIVNYRTASLAISALGSLIRDIESLDAHVYVVDNASGDGSADAIQAAVRHEHWGDKVTVLRSPTNCGFGSGNNLAIRHALAADVPPRSFLLLNPDATLYPGSCQTLMSFLDRNPRVGAVGAAIYDPDGIAQSSAFRFPSVLGELEQGLRLGLATRLLKRWVVAPGPLPHSQAVDWVTGACMMLRRELVEEVGLFDDAFFLYFEETDLCRRAKRRGWQIHFVKEAAIRHVEAASTGRRDRSRRMPPYWFASRRHYFTKQHGTFYFWAASAAWAGGHLAWRVRRVLQRKDDTDPPLLLLDFVRYTLFPAADPRTKVAPEAGSGADTAPAGWGGVSQ